MANKKAITKQLAGRYRRSSKTQKGVILDELCALTGWSRDHARRALRQSLRDRVTPPKPRSRAALYDQQVVAPLRKIWAVLGGPCGKRLAPFMNEIVEAMERFEELDLSQDQRSKLLRMSAATIDRLLAEERRRLRIKGRSGTKPGSMLKAQIPIRTFADWDECAPGFVELDLVGHDGGSGQGDYAQTLNLTDVASGWTEPVAVKNKAQRWVFQALQQIEGRLPFQLRGIDSDNGSEFINNQLLRYCSSKQITFTRSRPYRKNDNCFVEQKNWTVVRQAVGYLRYDTDAELQTLNQLYALIRLEVNFFQPQMKLVSKSRQGAKVKRRYDLPRTPYQRLLTMQVSAQTRTCLREQFITINPVELRRRIGECQDDLILLNRKKMVPTPTAERG